MTVSSWGRGIEDFTHRRQENVAKEVLNVEKRKIMMVGKWNETDRIVIDDEDIG